MAPVAIGTDTGQERLVFVQSSKPARIGDTYLPSWDCVALRPGEVADATALAGTLMLVVGA